MSDEELILIDEDAREGREVFEFCLMDRMNDLWLEGRRVAEIAEALGVEIDDVLAGLSEFSQRMETVQ